jgi:hypothetical protein
MMSPSANPQSAAAICHKPLTPGAAFIVSRRSPASVGGFPAWNFPKISTGAANELFGRQRRK